MTFKSQITQMDFNLIKTIKLNYQQQIIKNIIQHFFSFFIFNFLLEFIPMFDYFIKMNYSIQCKNNRTP